MLRKTVLVSTGQVMDSVSEKGQYKAKMSLTRICVHFVQLCMFGSYLLKRIFIDIVKTSHGLQGGPVDTNKGTQALTIYFTLKICIIIIKCFGHTWLPSSCCVVDVYTHHVLCVVDN